MLGGEDAVCLRAHMRVCVSLSVYVCRYVSHRIPGVRDLSVAWRGGVVGFG